MQWVYALFLGLIALGFHITSILLPAAFFLCFISKTIRSSSWYFLLLGFLVYFFRVPIMEPVTIKLTNIMGGHYHSYTRVLVTNQNSSGLAFWYAQFLVCILIFARYFGTVNVDKLPRIYSLLLSVCVFGCGLIFWLYETVIIGSRLSDVLLILLVPLLGIMMTQLKFSSRVLFIVFLSLFFGARFFQLFVR